MSNEENIEYLNNETLYDFYKNFDWHWEYQQGSLMLKSENSSIEWKKQIAVFFYRMGYEFILNKCAELSYANNVLKSELNQQKFNNKNNLSIDQQVSDEIERLKAEIEKLTKRSDCIGFDCMYESENQRLKELLKECKDKCSWAIGDELTIKINKILGGKL